VVVAVLARQTDLIDADRFAAACTAWSERRDLVLADWLVERGWLTAHDRADVERWLERKLKKHGDDARASLADAVKGKARQVLTTLAAPPAQYPLTAPPAPSPPSPPHPP